MGRGAPRVLESPLGAAEHERRAVVGGVRHERERLRRERDSLPQRELSRWTSRTNEWLCRRRGDAGAALGAPSTGAASSAVGSGK